MDISIRLFLVGIFGVILGMIGALVMVEMVNQTHDCISRESDHPPDKKIKNKKGGSSDG